MKLWSTNHFADAGPRREHYDTKKWLYNRWKLLYYDHVAASALFVVDVAVVEHENPHSALNEASSISRR